MLEFVRISFRILISIALWIVLIACPILGFFVGSASGDNAAGFIGVFIGFLVGIFTIVILGGYIATMKCIVKTSKAPLSPFCNPLGLPRLVEKMHNPNPAFR
jgi:hypothetical protein